MPITQFPAIAADAARALVSVRFGRAIQAPAGEAVVRMGASDGPVAARIVTLGDSLLHSAGVDDVVEGFAPQLAERIALRLGAAVDVHRHAVIGHRARDISGQVAGARASLAQADMVLLSVGGNDAVQLGAAAPFGNALRGALSEIRTAAPNAEIAVLGIPEVRHASVLGPTFGAVAAERADELRAVQRAAARESGATFLDIPTIVNEPLALHPEYLSRDGFHPNAAGYAESADRVVAELDRLAAWPRAMRPSGH